MKNVLFLLLFALPIASFGQVEALQNFYDKYKNKEEVTDVTLKGWLLKATSTISTSEKDDKLLDKITYFRVLLMEEGNLVSDREFKQLKKDIRKAKFEELIKIREDKSDIEILVKDDQEFITDAILLVHSKEKFVLLSMEGRFKLSDFKNINIDIDGADHFKKVSDQ